MKSKALKIIYSYYLFSLLYGAKLFQIENKLFQQHVGRIFKFTCTISLFNFFSAGVISTCDNSYGFNLIDIRGVQKEGLSTPPPILVTLPYIL